jgi:hypothetical protein
MQHLARLRIPARELAVIVGVPAALVAVVPEQDARVVHVPADQLADEPRARGCVIRALPAGEFVEDIEAEFVRGLEERRIGWIVRHAHGVHVGALDEPHIGEVLVTSQRPPRGWPE